MVELVRVLQRGHDHEDEWEESEAEDGDEQEAPQNPYRARV